MIIKYEITPGKNSMYTTRMFELLSESSREHRISEALADNDYILARDIAHTRPNQWELCSSSLDYYADLPLAYRRAWLAAGKPAIFYVIVDSPARLYRTPNARYEHRHNRHDWKRTAHKMQAIAGTQPTRII